MKIRKTKAGTYTTQFAIYDSEGKRHVKRITRDTKREVQQAVLEYQTIHKVYEQSKTLKDTMQKYIDLKKKVLSPSTIRSYKMYQRKLESEYSNLMSTNLDNINQMVLQNFINDFSISHKSKTVKNYVGLIASVMLHNGYQVPQYDIKKDREQFTPNVPNAEIVRKVAATAKGTRWELPFALACMGLRRSEIAGVTSADLSDDNVLHIRHALVMGIGSELHTKTTKTTGSDRYILIPDQTAALLRQQGKAWKLRPEMLTQSFSTLLKRSGVDPFRLHDCRHFFASYCHDILRLSDAQIQKLGGWKTDHVMKRVYITSISDSSKEVEQAFSEMLT